MPVVIISISTPYRENVLGTSALAFHLIKGWMRTLSAATQPTEVQGNSCIIYSYNANRLTDKQITEVEQELEAEIRLLTLPRWYHWLFKFHLLFLRVFLKYPFVNYIKLPQRVVDEIKALYPDLIWVNSEEMSRIPKQFPERCFVCE